MVSAVMVTGSAIAGPTPQEYAAHVGGEAKIVAAGELKLDRKSVV